MSALILLIKSVPRSTFRPRKGLLSHNRQNGQNLVSTTLKCFFIYGYYMDAVIARNKEIRNCGKVRIMRSKVRIVREKKSELREIKSEIVKNYRNKI